MRIVHNIILIFASSSKEVENLRQISSDKVGLIVVHALRGHRLVQTVHLIEVTTMVKQKQSNWLCDHHEEYSDDGIHNDGDDGQVTSLP